MMKLTAAGKLVTVPASAVTTLTSSSGLARSAPRSVLETRSGLVIVAMTVARSAVLRRRAALCTAGRLVRVDRGERPPMFKLPRVFRRAKAELT